MRTTITVDDDLLKQIDEIARREKRSRRDVLNELLRYGIDARAAAATAKTPYRTEPKDLGRCLLPSIDAVRDALAVAEGDDYS